MQSLKLWARIGKSTWQPENAQGVIVVQLPKAFLKNADAFGTP